MLKNNKLLPLTLIAVVAYLLAVVLNTQEQGQTEFEQLPLLGEFKAQSAAIDSITLENAEQGIVVKADKGTNGWRISNKQNYQADAKSLSSLVAALVKAQLMETKTKFSKNYSRLGVEELTAESSQSTLLTLTSGDFKWQLLLGKSATNGRYVRMPGEVQSWLADLKIELPVSASDWLNRELVALEEANIAKVSLSQAGSDEQIVAIKEDKDQADFTLANFPKNKKLKYDVILNPLARNFAALKLNDVKGFNEEFWQSLESSHKAIILTFEGEEILAEFKKQGDDSYWLQLSSASFHQSMFWAQWLFKVDSFTAKQFFKTTDDYLEDETSEQIPE